MEIDADRWFALVPFVALPGLAVGSLEPSVVVDTPWLRALGAFLLAVPVGMVLLRNYGSLVDRGVDASTDRPLVSTVYGVMAHLLLFFAAMVVSFQLASTGLDETVVLVVGVAVLGMVFLSLAGFGLAVLGVWLVEFRGEGRPWHGLVAAGAIGAVGWLLPLIAGIAVWMALVSVGIGGSARRWVHAERSVEAEIEG
jgi:4-hydroxybenzoate polyprenyltransferase